MTKTFLPIDGHRIIDTLLERQQIPTPDHYKLAFCELYPWAMPDFETHLEYVAKETPVLLEAVHELLAYAQGSPHPPIPNENETPEAALLRSTLNNVQSGNSRIDEHLLMLVSRLLMVSNSVFDVISQAKQEITTTHQHVIRLKEQLNSSQQALDISLELLVQDNLTGALNRRALDHVLTREVTEPRTLGHPKRLVMAMLDIDFFKKINDQHGHSVGDQALVHFCKHIRNTLREYDYLVRYGGEEFLLVMPDADIEGASFAIERLRTILNNTPIIVDEEYQLVLRFSAGLCALQPDHDPYEAIRLADEALYLAKQNGRNCLKIAGKLP